MAAEPDKISAKSRTNEIWARMHLFRVGIVKPFQFLRHHLEYFLCLYG